jgi:hypothetical protein
MSIGRIINALVWIGVFLATAIAFHGFDDPFRLTGEAVVPFILWFIIDWIIRARSRAA